MDTIENNPTTVEVSAVLPFYKEAGPERLERFKRTIYGLHTFLDKAYGRSYEIIGVSDGSIDGSDVIARHAGLTVIDADPKSKSHRGKGTAVLAGLDQANGRIRFFTDADGAYLLNGTEFEPRTILSLCRAIENGADMAVAERVLGLRAQKVHKRNLGHIGTARFLELIAATDLADPQAGAKAFNAETARQFVELMSNNSWQFGADRAFGHLAKVLDLKVVEVGALIDNADGSHVRPMRDGLKLLFEAVKARRLGNEALNNEQIFTQFEPELAVLNS